MIISHRLKFVYFRVPKTGSSTAETMLRLCGAFDMNDYMTASSGMRSTLPIAARQWLESRVRVVLDQYFKIPGKPFDADYHEQRIQTAIPAFAAHLTPKDAIKIGLITLDQLREYKVVAFVRDPYDRHLSAFRYSMPGIKVTPDQYKDLVKSDPRMTSKEMVLTRPTTDYFFVDGEQVTEPLYFDDFANEVRRMIAMVNGYYFEEIPQFNPSRTLAVDREEYNIPEVRAILDQVLADDIELLQKLKSGEWKKS